MTPQPLAQPGSPTPAPKLRWWKLTGAGFLIISIAAHLLFGVAATYLVVQTIRAKRKQTFGAPPASANPATRALEHKVQMQKKQQTMSAPSAVKRITTTSNAKIALPAMPAMPQLDSTIVPVAMAGMGGSGVGLGISGGGGGGGGGGGRGINLFGVFDSKRGAGLEGTFYDLKQTTTRQATNMTPDLYGKIVTGFVSGGFNEGLLARFFHAPSLLYTTQIWIPRIPADRGPAAFHLENVVKPSMWCVLYKGTVVAPQSFTFHFVGAGDDVMLVRFNRRLVLDRCWYIRTNWKPLANYAYDFTTIPNGLAKGDAIHVEAGQSYPMEVLIGEQPGGEGFATLLQEVDGVTYDKDSHGSPILPVFRMADVKPAASTPDAPYPPHRDDGPVWKAGPLLPDNP